MFSNRFTVVPDACVLADVAKRQLILNETEFAIRHILAVREDANRTTTFAETLISTRDV